MGVAVGPDEFPAQGDGFLGGVEGLGVPAGRAEPVSTRSAANTASARDYAATQVRATPSPEAPCTRPNDVGRVRRRLSPRCRLPRVLRPNVEVRGFLEPRAAYPGSTQHSHALRPRAPQRSAQAAEPNQPPRVADASDRTASCPVSTARKSVCHRLVLPLVRQVLSSLSPPAASRPQGHRGGLVLQHPDGAWRKHAQRLR